MSLTPEELDACWYELKSNAPKSISWNHYDLAAGTCIKDVELWKQFIQLRDVSEWLEEERVLLQRAELIKLSTDISNTRSVGQAQLISTMDKLNSNNRENTATGPAYIYTYIPLNAEQAAAPNVKIMDEDIFYVKPAEFKFDPTPPELST